MNPHLATVRISGHARSGKTTVFQRFIYDRFEFEYESYSDSRKPVMSGTSWVFLNVYDITGFISRTGTRCYVNIDPGTDANIVCFDLTEEESFKDAKLWVEFWKHKEPASMIYLCGTKKDLVDDGKPRAESQDTISRYAEEIKAPFIETSSKTGENIDGLFQKIADDFLERQENCEVISLTSSGSVQRESSCSSVFEIVMAINMEPRK